MGGGVIRISDKNRLFSEKYIIYFFSPIASIYINRYVYVVYDNIIFVDLKYIFIFYCLMLRVLVVF